MSDDAIARTAARLKALYNNLPKRGYVDRQHVEEYHDSLDYLEAADYDVAEFRIQDSWLKREILAEGGLDGSKIMSEPRVEATLFHTKLESVLAFLAGLAQKSTGPLVPG